MPSPIAHGSLTMLALPALGSAPSGRLRRVLLTGLVLFACVAPDMDILVGLLSTGDGFADHGHRSHSLLLAPGFGVMFAALARAIGWRGTLVRAWAVGTLLYALHVVMDLLTIGSRGVGLLWPIVPERIASPFGVFVGVEHGEWWLWREHLLTLANESVFAGVIYAIARMLRRRRADRKAAA
jgi:membrane-bound metal-dependent hydrolase YbcI (DUF457 family)